MAGKLIGVVMIICGCGGMGWSIAAAFRREEAALRQMIGALDYMECELQYHLTPLPDLCRQAGRETKGISAEVLTVLAAELESQIQPDVGSCMEGVLLRFGEIPGKVRNAFELMGTSLGRFDMEGQIRGLEMVRSFCRRELEEMGRNRESRLRSYQTLSLCAGAALAILFV